MTGQQSKQLTPLLNQNLLNLVWLDDLYFRHRVVQSVPERYKLHAVALFEQIKMFEVVGTAVATVTGNNSVGVGAAYRQAGVAHMGSSRRHVFLVGSKVNWHGQFQAWDIQNGYSFIFKAVVV